MADRPMPRLDEIDLFAHFSKRALRKLEENGRVVVHQPDHKVAVEGEGAAAFHYVLEGTGTVEVAGTERRELRAGDYFGEISLIDGEPRSATVRAGEGGLVTFAVSAFWFGQLIDSDRELTKTLLVNLCRRLREAEAAG